MASVIQPTPQGLPTVEPTASNPQDEAVKDVKPKVQRPRRPNYAQIHSQPLPVTVFPLPAFIPHNPLSIVRVAIAMISHSFWPPSPQTVIHTAYFSAETQSIHVTDPKSIRALWEQGFWGSGSLSRSEPRWLDLEKRKRGIQAMQTSEEVTQQRRKERQQFKLERARLEREAIEEQRRAEGKVDVESAEGAVAADVTAPPAPIETVDRDSDVVQETLAKPELEATTSVKKALAADDLVIEDLPVAIQDQEHLQLTLEEAFFLSYVLGVLEIHKDGAPLPRSYLFRLYCAYSAFPAPEDAERNLYKVLTLPTEISSIDPIAPDNQFLMRYAVFHHFRSLGWVVRSGIKFAVDFLLYNRGPAFSHAEFAVMIVPSYSHPYWSETPERKQETQKKAHRDWWWLHRINRVQGLAHKALMLVYVEVPPPWDLVPTGAGFEVDIGAVLKKYEVREFVIGRWTPNRHR